MKKDPKVRPYQESRNALNPEIGSTEKVPEKLLGVEYSN